MSQSLYWRQQDLTDQLLSEKLDQLEDGIEVEELYLFDNSLESFPNLSERKQFKKVQKIDVSRNKISALNGDFVPEGVVELDLRINQLLEVPDITHLQHLQELDLSFNQINTLPDMSELSCLRELGLNNNNFSDVPGDDLPCNITKLNLGGNKLTTINNISHLKSLKSLYLHGNNLSDVPGDHLPCNTTQLNLGGNKLTTINNISHLKSLKSLGLSNNNLSDVPGDHLPCNITKLNLSGNKLTTINNISHLKSLKSLGLSDNNLSDVPGDHLPCNITELDLWKNKLTTVNNISHLKSLKSLGLSDNNLSDVPGDHLPCNITELDLWKNKLTTINNISHLKSLKSLYLHGNNLSDVPGDHLPCNITQLNLGGNKLTTINNISHLKSLESLDLSNNNLSDVPGDHLPCNITKLNLVRNKLATINNISHLKSLKSLDLSNNNLSDVPGDHLPCNITELDLGGNKLTTINNISHLNSLESLDLSHNNLSDVPADHLPCNITELDATGNNLTAKNISHLKSVKSIHLKIDLIDDPESYEAIMMGSVKMETETQEKSMRTLGEKLKYFKHSEQPAIEEAQSQDLQEHFRQQNDHTKKDWSELEKQYFVQTCVLHILLAGETFFGKTSIARSLLQMFPYTAEVDDRTRVLECWSLKIGDSTSVSLYDLGGHSSYKILSHLFHNNSPHKITMIPHDITNVNYGITCQWLTDIITRSPKMLVWLILTKCDLLQTSEIEPKKADFTTFVTKYLEDETKSLEYNIDTLSDETQKSHVRDVIKKYMSIREELKTGQILHLVSCKRKDDILKLHSSISKLLNTEDFKVNVLPQVCELYTRLGKLGLERAAERIEALNQKATKESNHSKEKNKELRQPEITGNDQDQLQSHQHEVDDNMDLPQVEKHRDFSQIEEHKMQSQGNEHIPILQYAEFQEVLKIYEEILPESLSQASLEKDLKKALQTLCSLGLILWFSGTKNLQRFIFNDIGSFVNMLKSLFVPDIEELYYKNLDEQQKKHVHKHSDSAKHDQSVLRLSKQGLMDVLLLKTLTSKFDFHEHHDVVVDLLHHLSIAHKTTQDDLLFFPWYLSDSESTDIHSLIAEMSSKETVCWHICLKGHLPSAFYHAFCVRVYKDLLPDVDTQQRKVCKNHLSASIDDVDILIQHQKKEREEDEINIYIKSPLCESEVHTSWEFIHECEEAFKHLKETWWYGFGSCLIFKCPDCPLRGLTCDGFWSLDTVTKKTSQRNKKCCCPVKNNQKFPAALIYPLSKDEDVAEKCLEELRQHLQKHQKGQAVTKDRVEGDASAQIQIDAVKHKQSTPMQVRPKEHKASTKVPQYSVRHDREYRGVRLGQSLNPQKGTYNPQMMSTSVENLNEIEDGTLDRALSTPPQASDVEHSTPLQYCHVKGEPSSQVNPLVQKPAVKLELVPVKDGESRDMQMLMPETMMRGVQQIGQELLLQRSMLEQLTGKTDELSTTVKEKTDEISTTVKEKTDEISTTVKEKTDEISTTVKEKTDEISTTVKEKTDEISTTVKERTDEISTTVKEKTDEISTTVKEKTDEISTTVKEKTDEISTTVKERTDEISTTVKEKTDEISTTVKEKTDEISTTVNEKTDQLSNTMKEKTDEISTTVNEKTNEIKESTEQLSSKVTEQTKEISSAVTEQAKEISSKVTDNAEKLITHIKLDAGSAGSLDLNCSHYVLKQHQSLLEENLDPDDPVLLQGLYSNQVISATERSGIENDKQSLGKTKRLLLFIDKQESKSPGTVLKFIKVLERSKEGTNNYFLAPVLRETLEGI